MSKNKNRVVKSDGVGPPLEEKKPLVVGEESTTQIFGLDKDDAMFQDLPKVQTTKLKDAWGAK